MAIACADVDVTALITPIAVATFCNSECAALTNDIGHCSDSLTPRLDVLAPVFNLFGNFFFFLFLFLFSFFFFLFLSFLSFLLFFSPPPIQKLKISYELFVTNELYYDVLLELKVLSELLQWHGYVTLRPMCADSELAPSDCGSGGSSTRPDDVSTQCAAALSSF
eukprot:SAG11_NODE_4248_length_1987_cov_1.788136_1_plen_164_part_10